MPDTLPPNVIDLARHPLGWRLFAPPCVLSGDACTDPFCTGRGCDGPFDVACTDLEPLIRRAVDTTGPAPRLGVVDR